MKFILLNIEQDKLWQYLSKALSMAVNGSDDDKTKSFTALTAGVVVSHYKIISKIGAGGMGEVYLAEDTKLKRQVALKFLSQHLCQDEDCRARFKREAQAAASLKHHNIVTIYEVSEYNGRPYIAMENVDGTSLRHKIKDKKMSIKEAIELTIQICEGLHEAHESGIVHRDVKPGNIIVDNKERPKLVDFGLAQVAGGTKLTKTGSTLGTIGYMSPEQVKGEKSDHRSDIFSVGVILYEMITGKSPFEAEHEAAIQYNIINEQPEPMSRYKSGVSSELQQLIDKALIKDPSMRYQHADGMLADLKRLLSETVPAKKPANKWNRYVVPSALVVLLAIFVIWKFGFEDQTPAKTETEKIMLAVLPFENLGAPEDEYFADGLTEEITSKLGIVSKLGVISRTSTMLYKNTDKDLPTIADELGVDYIIEGTVRWDKSGETSMVRITPQLIRVSDNIHLWANNYERPLTRIFSVQADIAEHIMENLDITLLQPERDALVNQPTENTEAYTYYLKSVEYINNGEFDLAEQMILKSIALDSNFAEAYAEYSYINSYQYFHPYADLNKDDDESELAKIYAQKAYEMNPESPYTLRALGFHSYYVESEYEKALGFFKRGLEYEPNNIKLKRAIGHINFRTGRYEEAYRSIKNALFIDPGNSIVSMSLAHICIYLRKGEEAIEVLNRALEFSPDNLNIYVWKIMVASFYFGSPSMIKGIIDDAIANNIDIRNIYKSRFVAFDYEHLNREFEKIVGEVKKQGLQGARTFYDSTFVYYNMLSYSYYYLNDTINLRLYADSMRNSIESNITSDIYMRLAGDSYNKELLAEAYFYLGDKEKGLQLLNEVAEIRFIEKDGANAPWGYMWQSAKYIMMGEHEKGLDMIEYLLSRPSPLNIAYLKIAPIFDPVRDHPRFKALIEKYEGS